MILDYNKLKQETKAIVVDIIERSALKKGQIFVLGLSSSEVSGGLIGKNSSSEIGEIIVEVILKELHSRGIYLAVQGCEHVNRALVVEAELAERQQLEVVNVVPNLHAGGSGQVAAFKLMTSPVEVEEIVAHAGIDIGLGAQGFLSDVVNGFFILLENQFDVGDIINVGAVSGTVTNVGIRTTQIHDFDGTLHFIPNRNITIVSNKSRSNMRAQIDIPLFVHTNLDQISDIVTKINEEYVSKHPAIVGEPTVFGPTTNANGQFVYRINIFTQNGAQFDIYAEFYKLYQKAILEEGIDLPTYNFSNNHSR